MIKVGNVYIGTKDESYRLSDSEWAIVHACKTSHQERLGYDRPIKESPYYIEFRENNHLYLNWVDEPTGRFFQIKTFEDAFDFMDEFINNRKIFIHCDQGQSRSPTLAMSYLAKRTDYLPDDFNSAVEKFRAEYPNFYPNGIIKFVQLNWKNIK